MVAAVPGEHLSPSATLTGFSARSCESNRGLLFQDLADIPPRYFNLGRREIGAEDEAGVYLHLVIHPAQLAFEVLDVEASQPAVLIEDLGVVAIGEECCVVFVAQFDMIVITAHDVPETFVSDIENLDGG